MIDDDLIARQVQLLRLAAGERAKVLVSLKQMEEELAELLYYSGKPLTDIARADKAKLLSQAQAVISRYYGQITDDTAATLGELGRIEAAATVASLGEMVREAVEVNLPPEGVLKRLADDTLIEGAPSAAWWKRHEGDLVFRFKNAVAQGIQQAETNDEIIRRIRGRAIGYQVVDGKRIYSFAGGIMDKARYRVAAQVQTSVQAVANRARMDTFEENEDIIKGFRQLSTLDGHTTPICVGYSGAEWDFQKRPINGNKLPFVNLGGAPTGTPRHWNCRSVVTPITKTFRELGLDLDELPASTRAASGGPVSNRETMAQYIKRRGPKFADELLGPGRAQLFLDGKMTLPQLLDQTGRPITVKQLRRLYAR